MMFRTYHGPVRLVCVSFYLLVFSYPILGRRHNLTLKDDVRKNFAVSTFGFMKGGALMVDISEFSFDGEKAGDFLFSIEKTASDGVSNYLEHHTEKCRLNQENTQDQVSLMLLELDLAKEMMNVRRLGQDFHKIGVSDKRLENKAFSHQDTITSYAHKASGISTINPSCPRLHEWYTKLKLKKEKKGNSFHGVFTICMNETAHEGLYNVFFHNCANYDKTRKSKIKVNLVLNIIEHNDGTYLSAGEIPLPILYGLMSVAFFVIGCTWVVFLNKHRDWMYKVHYVMAVLTFLKSFSLAFHAINFYYIGKDGRPMESWAVLYYITHLLKGALLFTTIVLIGTGFFFVKHILSTKEKRIFMIVIPLQILTNVAQIMTESIEEGKAQYTTWHQIFVLVDLICCGAVLFPVVWSIRHLQEAAKTDGKAATSLAKLKLFRHFYVMIVCYIYFTRIIVYLIKITVPFKFMWLDEFFTELGTFVFFMLTGYKFRPAPANPYLHVPGDDSEDDIEMNEITMQSGVAEGLTRVQSVSRRAETYAA